MNAIIGASRNWTGDNTVPVICPTVLASSPDDFKDQVDKIAHLGNRLQVDLTDGLFAESVTVSPDQIWWPVGFKADIHFMYREPLNAVKTALKHTPHLVIIHAEAAGSFDEVYKLCRDNGVKMGVALLPSTDPSAIRNELSRIDHVLIFSGDLGNFGGHADLSLLDKADYLKQQKPDLELGWDGGVNDRNVSELVFGGIDVLNVGGYIQKAENPEKAYDTLMRIADETGTT
jgi:ribulose-phosphate 3-epimerase